jgi:hypothetical protein
MTPQGLLLEFLGATIVATLFGRYYVYRGNGRTAAAWRLFWRGAVICVPLCVLGIVWVAMAPTRPLMVVGLGINVVAGLAGLLVMTAAGTRALRHGVRRGGTPPSAA